MRKAEAALVGLAPARHSANWTRRLHPHRLPAPLPYGRSIAAPTHPAGRCRPVAGPGYAVLLRPTWLRIRQPIDFAPLSFWSGFGQRSPSLSFHAHLSVAGGSVANRAGWSRERGGLSQYEPHEPRWSPCGERAWRLAASRSGEYALSRTR